MSHYTIDYFATLGREAGVLKCKSFPMTLHEDDPPYSGNEIWQEAITDIAVFGGDEILPEEENWIVISESLNSQQLEYPQIAFRKRKDSGRLDHITHVKFISPGEIVPAGYELIRSSIQGKHSSVIKSNGFLAIKRALGDTFSFLNGEQLIFDLCAVKKSLKEELPERYIPLEKDSNGVWASLSSDLAFAARYLPPMGLCNLSYEAITLDRYPLKDISPDLPLPELALPVFAFPRNLRLETGLKSEYPLPVFYTFVFTDQEGRHMFAACLKFYEPVPLSSIEPLAAEIFGDSKIVDLPEDIGIFCPKVICVLSHKPFYKAMGRYLKHIYSLSLSSTVCPIENYITSVVGKIPMPYYGGRPFHVILDAALIAATSKPMKPIIFQNPPQRFFPLMDLDFAGPMRCMSVDVMLAVFLLMLRESKILFLSSSNTMLTETMETLRCLLFPLCWSSCFVSRLPQNLSGLLQAPGGFMVGVHIEPSELLSDSSNSHHVSKANLQESMKKFIQQMHFDYPMLPGTYVVDLNANSMYMFNGKYSEPLQQSSIENLVKTMPNGPKLRLRTKLQKIADDYQIAPQLAGLEELDSAFDFQQSADESEKQHWENFPTLEIRDSFMVFMIDLLGDYAKYMNPPSEDLTMDTYRTFQEEFAVQSYLHDCSDTSCKHMLEYLMETQMFSSLLQQRSEATAESLVFFEQAALLMRELQLSAGGHCSTSKPSHGVCELPAPMYKLLDADFRWSFLSKVIQQQVLQLVLQTSSTSEDLSKSPNGKSYHLTFLSTSALTAIRTLGQANNSTVHEAVHQVTNQKLIELLVFIDFDQTMNPSQSAEHADGDHIEKQTFNYMRAELDRNLNLHLADSKFGPLILPGPVRRKLPTIDDQSNASEDDQSLYSYKNGWPKLEVSLLEQGDKVCHERLEELIKTRFIAINQVNPLTRLLIRSPIERIPSENVAKFSKAESLPVGNVKVHKDLTTALSAVLDISSISITLLSLRIMNKVKPINDILQILGIIAQIECWGVHLLLSENIWRAALLACNVTGGDVMRRISIVLNYCLKALPSPMEALTFGQYLKANTATKLKIPNANVGGEVLDQYLYVEEIGLTWLVQKLASIEGTAMESTSNTPNTNNASSNRLKALSKPNTEATELIAKQMILQRSEGLMPFYRPRQISATCIPRSKDSFLNSNSSLSTIQTEMQTRIDNLYVTVRPTVSSAARQGNLSSDRSKVAKSGNFMSNAASISPLNAMSKLGKGLFKSSNQVKLTPGSHNDQDSRSQPHTPPRTFSGFGRFLGGGNKSNETSSAQISPVPIKDGTPQGVSATLGFDEDETNDSSSSGSDENDAEITSLRQIKLTEDMELSDDSKKPDSAATTTTTAVSNSPVTKGKKDLVIDPNTPSFDQVTSPTSTETAANNTTPITNKTLNVSELQDRLLESFSQEFRYQKKALGISNSSPCPSCRYLLMDEELMNIWFRASTVDLHKPTTSSVKLKSVRELTSSSSNGSAAGTILCPNCDTAITPQLSVTCYQLHDNRDGLNQAAAAVTATEAKAAEEEKIHALWNETVLFISPFLLRYEIEELILQYGERIGNAAWLHRFAPALLYNIIWYTNRCSLPSGLLFNENLYFLYEEEIKRKKNPFIIYELKSHRPELYVITSTLGRQSTEGKAEQGEEASFVKDLTLPVIIGWQHSVVKAKINRLLEGLSGNYVDLQDLLPRVNQHDLELISTKVLSHLDGSPAAMRIAMLELAKCKSIFEYLQLPLTRQELNAIEKEKELQRKKEEMIKKMTHPLDLLGSDGSEGSERDGLHGNDDDGNDTNDNNVDIYDTGFDANTKLLIARTIYTTLIMLSVHFARFQITDSSKAGLMRDLEKEVEFDRIFSDCVKCVMSKSDFFEMKVDEEALVACMKIPKTNVVRGMFGLLP